MLQIENQNNVIEAKETNILNLQKHNTDLEQKLQKLLMEFTQVRTKAQEMLVQRDTEIKKLKTLNNKQEDETERGRNDDNSNNSGIESDSDSDEERKKGSEIDNFNSMENNSRAFIKNILLKYLEYSANA